ncbi:hypothetical protein [Methylobacterium dankookense]|uniref:Uncharacterized protein n=1 Tax=Methylobacterium dankookense TaxID=560405 RepID=A0A564FY85_9HYPH|nr:hypothetical protein [Methylobacterium dankookense]GJD57784.1 hypothetical protein IFDJLNFL_3697 [Methylobacterium dankookense]VUF12952.1 hypothetical protein MTDSW087_02647 [Methylobacterium dankookense]
MTSKATEAASAGAKAETQAALSPEALLKAVVTGGRAEAPAAAARRRLDPLLMAVGGGALALGLICGAGLTAASLPRPERTEGLAEMQSGIDAARAETARVASEVERLVRAVSAVQDAAESGRKESGTRSAALSERVGKAEQALSAKFATLSERVEQAEREAAARFAALSGQIEKQRAAAPAPVAPVAAKVEPAKAEPMKAEPVQTGSIEPKKDKPPVIETWAVRDVYDGMAILEDRRRRLVEVGPGGAVPGVGRVEGIERRGREWIVVTRQGLITPQAW